jgi:hypothetical protein
VPVITHPTSFPGCFGEGLEQAGSSYSQASSLAYLGLMLTAGDQGSFVESLPNGSADLDAAIDLGLPPFQSIERGLVSTLWRSSTVSEVAMADYAAAAARREPAGIIGLLRSAIVAPSPLVVSAATVASVRLQPEEWISDSVALFERLVSIPSDGEEALAAKNIAGMALSWLAPSSEALARLRAAAQTDRPEPGSSRSSAIVVPGTLLAGAPGNWWRPGGDYWEFLDALRGDVLQWGAWDRDYDQESRAEGARLLSEWARINHPQPVDVYAHSHGGSVAMLATNDDLRIRKLVLMSVPYEDDCLPDRSKVDTIYDIRVRLDYVLMLNRLVRFRNRAGRPDGTDVITIGKWFDHSASHDPDVWQEYELYERTGSAGR